MKNSAKELIRQRFIEPTTSPRTNYIGVEHDPYSDVTQQQITSPDGKLLTGEFGLERESLRVTRDGQMAHTPHPFPNDPHIVKDFCENQTEINTGVHTSADAVIDELAEHTERLNIVLKERGERLWFYSNPPRIKNADDIPIAFFEGDQSAKYHYRLYLAEKYGKLKMTLSGIHVNNSLSEKLLRQRFDASSSEDFTAHKNEVYLRLAESLTAYGWIINLLLSASPVCDGSYFSPERIGEPVLTRYASLRCGEEGYWNSFTPQLSYDSVLSYALSIRRYLDSGALAGVSELYYPIRLKPRGANLLNTLVRNDVNHIEIRNVDINPFSPQGIDRRDLQFIELLILYLVAEPSKQPQEIAVQNDKNAALFDIDQAGITLPDGAVLPAREAGVRLLKRMQAFYARGPYASDYSVKDILDYQVNKLTVKGARYADRIAQRMDHISSLF
ncbi:hypothetical protein [Ruminococcus sp.]|uniref:hypothetical protein n=1 Tax=Ruminococcus sp. TaxID=41978 RepID=UPI003890FD00